MRTDDFSRNWREVGTCADYDDVTGNRWHKQVFWHRQKPDIIYAGGAISSDGGKTWQVQDYSQRYVMLNMSVTSGDLLVGMDAPGNRLAVSTDAGQT
jgi:hypothetical protein